MPSRSPVSHVEVLESRCAPARLVAGILPPQFGVDLTSVPTLSHGDAIELIPPTISPLTSILTLEAPHGLATDLSFQTGSLPTQTNSQDVIGAGDVSGATLVATGGSLYFGGYGGTLSTTPSITSSGGSITLINGSTGVISFHSPLLRYSALRIPANFVTVDGPTPPQDFAPEIQPILISLPPTFAFLRA